MKKEEKKISEFCNTGRWSSPSELQPKIFLKNETRCTLTVKSECGYWLLDWGMESHIFTTLQYL